jgi:RNA polymerase sigma-70 factor (ECF subfamily)
MTQGEATELVNSLFRSWYPSLVRYAYRLTGDTALAQDVVQESFMNLYRELGAGKTIHNPRAWTFCVIRREIARQTRTHAFHGISLDHLERGTALIGPRANDPDLLLEQDDTPKILSRLSPREKEVMLLRMESLKCREIASELGISINSVTTLLARALKKLIPMMSNRSDGMHSKEEGGRVQNALPG